MILKTHCRSRVIYLSEGVSYCANWQRNGSTSLLFFRGTNFCWQQGFILYYVIVNNMWNTRSHNWSRGI